MWSRAELTRMRHASLQQTLAEVERRLENCRFHKKATAPGGLAESANSHAQWCELEAEYLTEIMSLKMELRICKPSNE